MRNFLIFSLIIAVLGLSSCEKEKKTSLSMKQVHQSKGVPVKVETVDIEKFSTHLSYFSSLSGVEESSAAALVSDKVERIHVAIGDYVEEGQLIISFPRDNVQAQYNKAKLTYDNTKTGFDRISRLKNSGLVTEQAYDDAKSQYEITRESLIAAEKMIRVTSPIKGFVTRLNVSESEYIALGTELFVISRVDKIKGNIWVSDKMIHEVKAGLPAVARWNGTELKGNVVRVDRGINPAHQAFGAMVEFRNPRNLLISGVTAEVRIETYRNPKAVVLEKQQVVSENMKQYVYLASGDTAQKRAVRLGKHQGILVEVLDGLNRDERLIVSGHRMVNDGVKINIIN